MSVRATTDYRDRIVDEAADWFARMQDSDLIAADREAFAVWLSASAEHVREYLSLTALHVDLGRLQSAPDAEVLIRAAQSAPAENVVSLFESVTAGVNVRSPVSGERVVRHVHRVARGPMIGALLAAMLAVVTVSVLWLSFAAGPPLYRTATGEQKSFPLPDGSVITLNAVSELRVKYTTDSRDVYLASGEALFDVAKDAARPFRVITGRAVIRAVGTRFNVYHRQADTTVSVVEGTIEVQSLRAQPGGAPVVGDTAGRTSDEPNSRQAASTPVRVTRGQRAHFDSRSGAVAVALADLEAATAWRERRLVFDSRSLSEVVAEFNLYNDTRIVIADSALGTVEVSGSFYANDPRSFALFLDEAGLAAPIVQSDGTIALRSQ